MNEVDIKTRASFSKSVNSKPVESVETAGSLAYINPFNYFATNSYDTFDSSNPFAPAVNYANYSDCGGETVATSNFMAGFASAVATVGTDCGGVSDFGGGACVSISAGSSDCGGGCSSGGFTSFC